jgi:hypothetical protein
MFTGRRAASPVVALLVARGSRPAAAGKVALALPPPDVRAARPNAGSAWRGVPGGGTVAQPRAHLSILARAGKIAAPPARTANRIAARSHTGRPAGATLPPSVPSAGTRALRRGEQSRASATPAPAHHSTAPRRAWTVATGLHSAFLMLSAYSGLLVRGATSLARAARFGRHGYACMATRSCGGDSPGGDPARPAAAPRARSPRSPAGSLAL